MAAEKNSSKKKKTTARTLADDIFSGIKKDEIVSGAQKVITSAVSVLEEEIAAGILAAKKIEKKVLDVEDIREDPDSLMNRIRRDTHEAVDLFLDALTAITKQVNKLADTETEKNEKQTATEKRGTVITSLETERPLRPGESETFKFVFFEDTEGPTKIKFQKTALFGPNGQNIAASAIVITPARFTLKPKEEKEITVRVVIPKTAAPGIYNAIISDTENSLLKILLTVEIAT